MARDWLADFDLPELHASEEQPYFFPPEVAATTSRIDCYIICRKKRICIGLELTAGLEENFEQQHQRKLKRYQEDLVPGLNPRWRFYLIVVEVGCCCFLPTTLDRGLFKVGLTKAEVSRVKDRCAHTACQCSYLIWTYRHSRSFQPPRLSANL